MPLSEQNINKLLKNHFDASGFVSIQKDSFEYLVHNRFREIIEEEPQIVINMSKTEKYQVDFGDVTILKPQVIEEDRTIRYITPAEARLRDLTYESSVCINISEKFMTLVGDDWQIVENNIHNHVSICKLPIMLQTSKCNLYDMSREEKIVAGECYRDEGGYFIIKGKERVLIAQERINYNCIYVFSQKQTSKWKYIAEIRSMSEETGHSVLLQCKVDKNGKNMSFSLPYITQDIPVMILFMAYGITDYEEIINIIGLDNENTEYKKIIMFMIYETFMIDSQEKAIDYISKHISCEIEEDKRHKSIEQIITNEILPHMGIISTTQEKVYFIGLMVNKIIKTFVGDREVDDRDHISNKRNENAGVLIGDLFRSLYKRFVRSLEPQLSKRQDIINTISKVNTITYGLKHSFSTGKWGVQKNSYIRQGVSQVLSRLTYGATLSHLRRLIIPIGKEGKNTKIRQLHCSQIGYVCPAETPEGQSSGIVKNFALLCKITDKISVIYVKSVMKDIDGINEIDNSNDTKIIVNGYWFGNTKDKDSVISQLREKRQYKHLHEYISISYNDIDDEILVFCDQGRLIRPLIPVIDGKLAVTDDDEMDWETLVSQQKIVYRDSYEVDNCVIAMNESELGGLTDYDYCEISPSMMLGVCAGIIPFPDHTQSPRNTYQSAMGKQAIGKYCSSNELRTDTVVHMLMYPQKPIVYTHASECMGFNDMASGINAIVAIACYTGFNQEDSVIISKSAIDKGLFRSFVFRTVTSFEKKRNSNTYESIELPALDDQVKSYNYRKLDRSGLIRIGETVKKGDVIIGKVLKKTMKSGKEQIIDQSVVVKAGEEGIIDKVFKMKTTDGYKMIKVKIRSMRIPEVGDKFASREAQKGTCGMIFSQEDMPFTSEGMIPDVIINPHCIPSRMTINQLLECLGAKSGCVKGHYRDATPFSSSSTNILSTLEKDLHDCGYDSNGNETMYNGFTGQQFNAKIFIGPVYYQRLKHLVADKIHARDYGNVQSLTRQPLEGRSRDGGLRFGEMERDCMISQGVSMVLVEQLFHKSDPFTISICSCCGHIPSNKDVCNLCENDEFIEVNIPFAYKLLQQNLAALNLKTSLFIKNE